MIKALIDAYQALGDSSYLDEAKVNYEFIKNNLMKEGRLFHSFHTDDGGPKTDAFLDDYAFMADAAQTLYESTFEERYIDDARQWADECIARFMDKETGLFYYTGSNGEQLFVRKYELADNVIPSSNSILAILLFKLGKYFETETYHSISRRMLSYIRPLFSAYPGSYSGWMKMQLLETYGYRFICIHEQDASGSRLEFSKKLLPNVIFAGGVNSSLPVMQNKPGNYPIQICNESECLPPFINAEEALKHLTDDKN